MKRHKKSCMCASCKSVKGLYKGKNNPNYKGGITIKNHICKEVGCGNTITYQTWYKGNGICRSCARKHEFVSGDRQFSDSHIIKLDILKSNLEEIKVNELEKNSDV